MTETVTLQGRIAAMPPLLPGRAPAATRVVVAMSGGVDSSVTAALLARQGYEVIGITLQLYDHGAAIRRKGACCAGQDIHDARRVAEDLGIPHYVLDYESRFRESVMQDFADSYAAGYTPIPCVRCNERVKFRDLLETARDLGADCLATGHYVRRTEGPEGPELHRPADADRDQSYFLFATTRDQLEYLRFPLGDLTKPEARALAGELGLAVAEKPDSQDICFVPDGKYTQIVERLRPDAMEAGNIVAMDGRVLGRHDGVARFTVGQRRGLGIAAGEPLFVIGLRPDRREVVVGPREALATHTVHLDSLNWLGPAGALTGAAEIPVMAKVRSTRPARPACLIFDGEGGFSVEIPDGEEGVAPGQACVLYDRETGSRVLGGGWISRATRAAGLAPETVKPTEKAVL